MDVKEEIKIRLPIEQLVAQYRQLTKKGRNFVCLCPFHNDSRPSFVVSPDKGIGFCFACNTGGDIFNFFMKIENVDFPTALQQLAEKAGVSIPEKQWNHGEKQGDSREQKDRTLACLEEASSFFQAQLVASPRTKDYVKQRGVTDALLQLYRIGYAPDSFSSTYDHLLKKGFSRSDIIQAGLGIQKDMVEERIYDRFRDRLMFPIMNTHGQIIAFGGRTMKNDDAKYINSPDHALYHKSSELFGFFQAKESIRTQRTAIVVEGYLDVVASQKAGVENAVAVCGTALTERHAALLKRYADTVILAFDQDAAGKSAAQKAFQLLVPQKIMVQCVQFPAKDPDEMVQKDSALFLRIIKEQSVPFIDAVITDLASGEHAGTAEGYRTISHTFFPLLQAISTSVELRASLEKASKALGVRESELSSDFHRFRTTSSHTLGAAAVTPTQSVIDQSPFSRFQLCLGIAMLYPVHRSLLSELIENDDIAWEDLKKTLVTAPASVMTADILYGISDADEAFRHTVTILSLYCEEHFAHWSENLALRELKKLCQSANKDAILTKQKVVIEKLKEARVHQNAAEEMLLLTQYQEILKLAKMASL